MKSSKKEKELLQVLKNKNLMNKQWVFFLVFSCFAIIVQFITSTQRFTWSDSEHFYSFGLCTKATNATVEDEAMIQIRKNSTDKFVIGRLDDVDLEGSDLYIRITFKKGDKYNNACGKAERNAVITIMCNTRNV